MLINQKAALGRRRFQPVSDPQVPAASASIRLASPHFAVSSSTGHFFRIRLVRRCLCGCEDFVKRRIVEESGAIRRWLCDCRESLPCGPAGPAIRAWPRTRRFDFCCLWRCWKPSWLAFSKHRTQRTSTCLQTLSRSAPRDFPRNQEREYS